MIRELITPPKPVMTPAAAKPAAKPSPQAEVQQMVRELTRPNTTPADAAAAQASVNAAVSKALHEELATSSAPNVMLTSSAAPAASLPAARTPRQAALDLRAFLLSTGRFGSAADKPAEVIAAQHDMGVKPKSDDDWGYVGPLTRAKAKQLGVTLPAKPATINRNVS